ncbi:MAG: peptidase C14, partial [Kamptonema sp. SIO4C4]|nr:peptidase C14 [Kamptonema sp. SIO4C4]
MSGRNWAIAIGINNYHNLQPLQYAQGDAEAVRNYFLGEVRFERVYYFSEVSPPIPQDFGPPIESRPTYAALRRFLRVRFEQPFLGAGDNFWFFFAGHGIREDNRDYLMPLDGDPGDVPNTAISLHYLTERLSRCGADNVVLLIDACRYEGRRAGTGVGNHRYPGIVTLYSCSPRESSYEIEQLQQGAFTHVLLQGLRLQGEGNCATVER